MNVSLATRPSIAHDLSRSTLLSVEDNPDHQFLLESALESDDRQWTVHHVVNLEAMASSVDNVQPNAILLDLGLGESRGLATLDRALELLGGGVPIVVLTADRDQSIGLSAVRNGAADFINKYEYDRTDVSLRVAFAVERFEARKKIEQTNNILQTLVASIGHDLRAPPRQIQFLAEMLEEVIDEKNDEATQAVRNIQSRAQHLSKTLQSTLDYVRQAAITPVREKTDLSTLFARVLEDHSPEDASRVTLTANCPLMVDPHLTYLMLGNLIGNGLKYWRGTPSEVFVTGTVTSGAVDILVRDTGIGMSPDVMARAILPAMRCVSGKEFQGTGFGLAIVKLLAEAHGGQLTLASEEGVGTEINLRLPGWRVIDR